MSVPTISVALTIVIILVEWTSVQAAPAHFNSTEAENDGFYYEYRPNSKTVCYGVLGCFNNTGPFDDFLHRPFQPLPDSPSEIGTKFILFTRAHRDKSHVLWSWDTGTVETSDFDAARKTKIIIHGYMNNLQSPWVKQMSDQLLQVGDFNVIIVDWLFGAVNLYQLSAVNTRVVGAEVRYLITQLQALKGLRNEDIHIIGHSLGAHVAGYVGSGLPGIARISGLDPAQPYFENTHTAVRLDPTDAAFVDVIHTDIRNFFQAVATGGYGIKEPCGHVDFYPNGGREQPECSTEDVLKAAAAIGVLEGLRLFVACNHMRAVYLYIESIVPSECRFNAFPCPDYEMFQSGQCSHCGKRCAKMGYYADQVDQAYLGNAGKNSYYIATAGYPRYCRENYFLRLKTDQRLSSVLGQIFINIQTSSASTGFHEVTEGPTDIRGRHAFFLMSNVTITPPQLSSVQLKWNPSSTWLGLGIIGHSGHEELELEEVYIEGAQLTAEVFRDRVVAPRGVITAPVEYDLHN